VSLNLDIETIVINGQSRVVDQCLAAEKTFCTLTEYSLDHSSDLPRILLGAPLSGHYSVLLRDMVIGLLPRYRVYVTNWINAGEVPASGGPFGLDQNIDYLLDFIAVAGQRVNVVALCQAVVPALAAVAILSKRKQGSAVGSLTLIGGPINPLAKHHRQVASITLSATDALIVIDEITAPINDELVAIDFDGLGVV
jgi:poly(3-hydroxybutyrate) depolymerase